MDNEVQISPEEIDFLEELLTENNTSATIFPLCHSQI